MPNYLYNGIELPALPEWNKDTHPYCTILVEKDFGEIYTRCYFTEYPMAQLNASTKDLCNAESDGNTAPQTGIIYYTLADGEWTNKQETTWSIFSVLCENLIYTNFDLYVFQTDILIMSASDPVPVGGEPETDLTNIDLYRKINGKPTKLTLYKKINGELKQIQLNEEEI